MKRTIFIAVACLGVTGAALSQEAAKPLARAGDRALLFDLSGLAYLATGNYEGGIGFQYYLGKDLALRLGVGFSTSSETDKQQNPPANQLSESKYTSLGWSLTPALRYNFAQSKSVLAYVGGVASFAILNQERTGNRFSLDPAYRTGEKFEDQTLSWGVAAMLGVEWFAWDNVSFAGEYRLGFVSGSGYTKSTNPNPTPTTTKVERPSTWTLGIGSANAASLTLAVYF